MTDIRVGVPMEDGSEVLISTTHDKSMGPFQYYKFDQPVECGPGRPLTLYWRVPATPGVSFPQTLCGELPTRLGLSPDPPRTTAD